MFSISATVEIAEKDDNKNDSYRKRRSVRVRLSGRESHDVPMMIIKTRMSAVMIIGSFSFQAACRMLNTFFIKPLAICLFDGKLLFGWPQVLMPTSVFETKKKRINEND